MSLFVVATSIDQEKLDQMVWQYAELEDRAGGAAAPSPSPVLPSTSEEPVLDSTAPSASAAAPVIVAQAPGPSQGGDIAVSNNGEGNNIAIRNTNSIVLTPMPMNAAAYGQPGANQPFGPLPNNTPVSPGQQQKESGDEAANKATAAAKAAEEKLKQTLVKLEPEWKNYEGDYESASFVTIKNSVCVVRGLVRGDQGLIGTLPEACRPTARLVFTVMKTNAPARVDVLADGRIYYVAGGGGIGWISLSGITFTIDTQPSFNLMGGWVSYGGEYRPISLGKDNGFCIVSGIIKDGSWNYFGNVDKDCWPDYRLIFSGNNHENIARVDLLQNGYIQFLGGSSNHGWVSFDGMIYTKTGGMPLTLLNDWSNYGYYRDAKYERVGNVCILSGLIKNVNGWSGHIATLPSECRPAKRLVFGGNVHVSNARVDILSDGAVVYVTGKKSWEWLSLSGIHFTVA